MKEKSHLGTLWASVWNQEYKTERRVFAALELVFFPLSLLTVFVLLPLQIVMKHTSLELSSAWISVFHILLSAAIGYITNYIALEMLFKPFEPSGKHWLAICTFGYWRQGLVPKNKKNIGVEIGRQIETKLLPPEILANELCSTVTAFLTERKITDDVRRLVTNLLEEHHDEICAFLVEKGDGLLDSMLEKYITRDTLRDFLRRNALLRVNTPNVRKMFADAALSEAEKHSREIVVLLQQEIRAMAKSYCEKKSASMGFMALMGIDLSSMVDKVLNALDWDVVEGRLKEKLHSDKTRQLADVMLVKMFTKLDSWLESNESDDGLEMLAGELRNGLREKGRALLQENVPSLVGQLAGYEAFWKWLDEKLLPTMLPVVENVVREKGHDMVMNKLRLAERVSQAVDRQDTRQFYDMINALAAQHLGAIQVLGYLLGGIIGALQLLA
ncbi:MAG: DUF445 family protein [Victivallales bacterium]|nr:DUF445 family protein [Victivallales bacterium]